MARESLPVAASRALVRFANGTTLRVAPFVGQATQWVNARRTSVYRMPAEDDTAPGWRQALAENEIIEQETIHLDVTGAATRAGYAARPENDRIVLTPSAPPPGVEQVVLYQDESGGVSWHFPDGGGNDAAQRAARAGWRAGRPRTRTFTIAARTVHSQRVFAREHANRGLLTKWGRKILKVLLIPTLSPLAGRLLVEPVVGAVERRHRRNLVRAVTPDDYRTRGTSEFSDWDGLSRGRGLLVLHGIFSTTDGMLWRLPRPTLERLHAHYEGRIIALDHLSVTCDPEANARFLLERLASVSAGTAGRAFEFDVLCHSRGGIVARTLVERGAALVPNAPCRFHNVFFAGTPNQGSPLADARHMVELIDVFTNLLTNFPDGPALYSIEVILALVKLMAHAFDAELPGVAAMGTEGYIRQVLNRAMPPAPGPPARYAAAASRYEPSPESDSAFFTARFADWVMDRVFTADGRPVDNDLVVPAEGVFAANGAPAFPIANPLVFAPSDRVWHCGYFSEPRLLHRMCEHFGVDAGPPVRVRGAPAGEGDEGRAPRGVATGLDLPPQLLALVHNPFGEIQGEIEDIPDVTLDGEPALEAEGAAAGGGGEGSSSHQLIAPVGPVSPCSGLVIHRGPGPRPRARKPRNEAFPAGTSRREDADWVIYVMGEESPYTVYVRSSVPADPYALREYGTLRLPANELPGLLEHHLAGLFGACPAPDGLTPAAFRKAAAAWQKRFAHDIEAFGRQLWTCLPLALREAYFRLYDQRSAPASIQVHSTDMSFPWELVVPFRSHPPVHDKRLQPLGIAHIIGRWKPSLSLKPPTSQILQVQRFCVVNPHYPPPHALPHATAEVEELQRLFAGLTVVTPADWPSVNQQVLERSDIQVFHFTGHGRFDQSTADLSELILEDGPLNALSMAGKPLCLFAQPLVYLNACSVGAAGFSVGRAAGFAATLLEGDGQQGGCTGLIAPYWVVNDERAKDFAVSLYRKLRMRRAVGEALQELRAEHPGDPTYLAYAYFGDAWLRCNFTV